MAGCNLFGYDYINKTDNEIGHFIINEDEAETVRMIFDSYANTNMTITGLIKFLESQGRKTKKGSLRWGRTSIARILKNTAYYGHRS